MFVRPPTAPSGRFRFGVAPGRELGTCSRFCQGQNHSLIQSFAYRSIAAAFASLSTTAAVALGTSAASSCWRI